MDSSGSKRRAIDHARSTRWSPANSASERASSTGSTPGTPPSRALYEAASARRPLRRVRIARAFTAYQHHTLVGRLVRRCSDRTAMVVAPNVTDLYRDDDVPGYQTRRLAETSLAILADLGDALDVPVMVTTVADGEFAATAGELAVQEVETRETPLGTAYESEEFQTQVYRGRGYWQTTIPYWVELLGAVTGRPTSARTPRTPTELEA